MQDIALSELFAQQVHVSRLQPILKEYIFESKQLELLYQLQKSGAPSKYQLKILDQLTRHINNSTAATISDDISEAHAQAVIANMHDNSRRAEVGEATQVIYRFEDYEIKIIEERDTLAKFGGTGYRTWEAALALGEYVFDHRIPENFIVELGAGTGFVSRVLTQLGHKVLATDGDPAILDRLDGDFNTKMLWWDTTETRELIQFKDELESQDPVIVAADVLYDPNNYAPFLFTARMMLSTRSYALVATTMRNQDTYALLRPECERLGLEISVVKRYSPEPGKSSKYFYLMDSDIEIIKLTLQQ